MLSPVRDVPWAQLSEFVAERMGLHFPPERWDDLRRGLVAAAQELGFDDAAACAESLLSVLPGEEQIRTLANHLTVGETYFFRDSPMFSALAEHVLPDLIRARRGAEQRLRIWSAACCSGEEPYSMAILLRQLLPDLRDWRVTILGTDINARFLRRAAAGVYGAWSFRDAPPGLQQRYFTRTADGRFVIAAEVRGLVTFAHLNLADDVYPSLATGTNAMDLILCRNVLMYFTPPQVRRVVGNLHNALAEGAWLAVSPSEASQALFPQFAAVNHPGVILYRKSGAQPPFRPSSWTPQAPAPTPPEPASARPSAHLQRTEAQARLRAMAESLYAQGRYAEAADLLAAPVCGRAPEPVACSLLARARANQGDFAGALAGCDRWIGADKLDPAAHYLRAAVLLEQGDSSQARTSLQRAVYLDPGHVLAHFALGNLARSGGNPDEAGKHFANALDLLYRFQPDEMLPDSDGLTAGRLAEAITAIREGGPAS
ncbi:MAG: CheR family methyltransferase [Burkholderiales bacterium]